MMSLRPPAGWLAAVSSNSVSGSGAGGAVGSPFVSTVPLKPAATNCPLPQASPLRLLVVPEFSSIQAVPFVEPQIAPSTPMASNRPSPQATR